MSRDVLAPADREKVFKEVTSCIYACLMSSKGGVQLERISRDYRDIVGAPIPYRKMGYTSLFEMLDQLPSICKVKYTHEGAVALPVPKEETEHIRRLVSNQRSSKKKPAKPQPRHAMSNWEPPAPLRPFRGQQSNRNYRQGPRGPGGSGRFPINNKAHISMQPNNKGQLRTPNYSNGGQMRQPVMPQQIQQPPQQSQQQAAASAAAANSRSKMNNKSPNNSNNNVRRQQHQNGGGPQRSYTKDLQQYFDQNNLGPVLYKTATLELKAGGNNKNSSKAKKATRYMSTVKVGDQSFRTYPQEYPTKEQAGEAAARLAVDKLSINENGSGDDHVVVSNGSASTLDQDIDSLVDRIVGLVGSRTNGVWSTQIDVEYTRKFPGKKLPDRWPDKVGMSAVASKLLRVDQPIPGRCIVYPIVVTGDQVVPEVATTSLVKNILVPSSSSPVSPPCANNKKDDDDDKKKVLLPPLQLPEEAQWDVYITSIHSPVNVCLRLLGDQYSNKFDDLVTNMELTYFESHKMPSDKQLDVVQPPQVGKLYAAKVEGDWHRVEVTNVRGCEITCYFIDHGDEDVLNVKDLRHLLPKFMQLPAQAKSVRLAGLEDYADSQSAQTELTNAALGRSLVGQVHVKDDTGIALVLYDTSGNEEDVNINAKLLEKLRPDAVKNGKFGSNNSSRITSPTPSQPPPLENPSTSNLLDSKKQQQEQPFDQESSQSAKEDLMSIDLASLKSLMPTNVPDVGQYLDITVTLAASPSNFTVQPWQNSAELEQFQQKLNAFYNNSSNLYGKPITSVEMNKDKFFAGRHMDGNWYRVKMNAMIDDSTVAARVVDFGDFTMIPLDQLQPLWPQFRNMPMQAVSASLADIVATNGDWTTEDTVWFSNRVVNRQFVSRIKDVTYDPLDDNVRISLSMIDTTHPTTDVYIEKQLVDDNKAVYLCV